MDIEKQREIVRLWNRMRRVEGPLAEEIRIQLLASFSAEAGGAKTIGARTNAAGDRNPARHPANVRALRQRASLNVPA